MNTDHLFIERHEIQKLVVLLREIPELVEELSVTLTRQDQLGSGGARVSMGEREQPLPFNVNASEVADDLHNTLVGWVRHVCESRVLDYTGSTSTIGLARWLDRNVIALAMTEGAGTALDEVQYAMRRARWATDRPPVRLATVSDPDRVEQARAARVTAAEAERMMPTLGHPPLKAETIRKWFERGKISQGASDCRYRLGDILDLNPRKEPAAEADQLSRFVC